MPLCSYEEDENIIEVPVSEFSLSDENLEELDQSFDPLDDDDNYGINHYCRVLDYCALQYR